MSGIIYTVGAVALYALGAFGCANSEYTQLKQNLSEIEQGLVKQEHNLSRIDRKLTAVTKSQEELDVLVETDLDKLLLSLEKETNDFQQFLKEFKDTVKNDEQHK